MATASKPEFSRVGRATGWGKARMYRVTSKFKTGLKYVRLDECWTHVQAGRFVGTVTTVTRPTLPKESSLFRSTHTTKESYAHSLL